MNQITCPRCGEGLEEQEIRSIMGKYRVSKRKRAVAGPGRPKGAGKKEQEPDGGNPLEKLLASGLVTRGIPGGSVTMEKRPAAIAQEVRDEDEEIREAGLIWIEEAEERYGLPAKVILKAAEGDRRRSRLRRVGGKEAVSVEWMEDRREREGYGGY
jgi:hypothetical protein